MTDWPERRLEPGFSKEGNVIHLTKTVLGMTAICGHYPVDFFGTPEDGVPCDACVATAEEEGYTTQDLMAGIWAKTVTGQQTPTNSNP